MARPWPIPCSTCWRSRCSAAAPARCYSNATTTCPSWPSWCAKCKRCVTFTRQTSRAAMQRELESVFAELVLGPEPSRESLLALCRKYEVDPADAAALTEGLERLAVYRDL